MIQTAIYKEILNSWENNKRQEIEIIKVREKGKIVYITIAEVEDSVKNYYKKLKRKFDPIHSNYDLLRARFEEINSIFGTKTNLSVKISYGMFIKKFGLFPKSFNERGKRLVHDVSTDQKKLIFFTLKRHEVELNWYGVMELISKSEPLLTIIPDCVVVSLSNAKLCEYLDLQLKPNKNKQSSEGRTKLFIEEAFQALDPKGWQYAFREKSDFDDFATLLTDYFETNTFSPPNRVIALKPRTKTKLGPTLNEIFKECSNADSLAGDENFINLVKVLSHFQQMSTKEIYKTLTRNPA